jgi:toxin ParE1/3/4
VTEVRWTPQAADDLQAIYDFIGRDSPHYAQVVVEDILAAIDRLERFPFMGRHVPERPREDLRELIKPPYRIVYRVADVVRILTIFRASRLFPSSLE